MEMVFGNCVGATKRQNDGSSSMGLGHGKRSRPCSENFDISTSSVSHESQSEEGECNAVFDTTMKLLDEAKIYCGKLQDQLRDKDKYYLQREKQLEEFYRSELAREKEILARNQYFAHKQCNEYAAKLEAKEAELAFMKVAYYHLSSENEIWQYLFKKSLENPHAVKAAMNATNTSMSWMETSTQRSERDEELPVTGELDDSFIDVTTVESSPQESPVAHH